MPCSNFLNILESLNVLGKFPVKIMLVFDDFKSYPDPLLVVFLYILLPPGPTPKSGTRPTPQGTNKSLKKSRLLRELAPDKDYLDNLMHNPNIKCKYKGNDTTVEKYIKETVEYLNARQEFWRQQLPANLK